MRGEEIDLIICSSRLSWGNLKAISSSPLGHTEQLETDSLRGVI